LDPKLLLRGWRRLREEILLFKVVFPALARFGTGNPEVGPIAARALAGYHSIPKASP
jgi:hypothetical protein